jgi:hypothetical protein
MRVVFIAGRRLVRRRTLFFFLDFRLFTVVPCFLLLVTVVGWLLLRILRRVLVRLFRRVVMRLVLVMVGWVGAVGRRHPLY